MTTVSVILPTRDRAALLVRAMQSVLVQTHRDLELIVVDDGSTDTTAQVVTTVRDPRVRYVRCEQSAGASAARNRGQTLAQGEYISFQDDDDVWLIERIERQLATLRAEGDGVALSLCGYFRLEPDHVSYIGGPVQFRNVAFSNGVNGDWSLIATPAWLVPARALRRAGGFDETIHVGHDWDLALRLSKVGRIVHCNEPLFIQDRVRGMGLMLDRRSIARDMETLMRKHGDTERWRPAVISRHYETIGRLLCTVGDLPKGRHWLRRAIGASWLNLRAWTFLLLSLFGGGPVARLVAVGKSSQRQRARLEAR